MTSSWQTVALQNAAGWDHSSPQAQPAPTASGSNLSNLNAMGLNYYGPSNIVTAEAAFHNWGGTKNPFITGSPQDIAFQEYKAAYLEKEQAKWLKIPEIVPEVRPSKRRLSMPRLKPVFETLHDIRLRLCGGLIFIGSKLYYVNDVRELDGDFLILCDDENGKRRRCWYKEPAIDLRSPEPQYFVYEGKPAFFMRWPQRQQRQVVSTESGAGRWVGTGNFFRISNIGQLMQTIGGDPLVWDGRLHELMTKAKAFNAIRMSKDVAFFVKDQNIHAEYRGRYLGEVKEDTICVDDCDYHRPWIGRDTRQIGCTLKAS